MIPRHPTELLRAFHEGELPPRRREDAARHLAACPACRETLAREREVERLLCAARPAVPTLPPEVARAVLAAALRQARPRRRWGFSAWACATTAVAAIAAGGWLPVPPAAPVRDRSAAPAPLLAGARPGGTRAPLFARAAEPFPGRTARPAVAHTGVRRGGYPRLGRAGGPIQLPAAPVALAARWDDPARVEWVSLAALAPEAAMRAATLAPGALWAAPGHPAADPRGTAGWLVVEVTAGAEGPLLRVRTDTADAPGYASAVAVVPSAQGPLRRQCVVASDLPAPVLTLTACEPQDLLRPESARTAAREPRAVDPCAGTTDVSGDEDEAATP